jgi:hypothetical protein
VGFHPLSGEVGTHADQHPNGSSPEAIRNPKRDL